MTFIAWVGLISYGATIFALIVGIFAVYNGRKTRDEITRLIKEVDKPTKEILTRQTALLEGIRDDIKEMDKSTKEILARISDTQDRQNLILERIEARL